MILEIENSSGDAENNCDSRYNLFPGGMNFDDEGSKLATFVGNPDMTIAGRTFNFDSRVEYFRETFRVTVLTGLGIDVN